MLAAMETHLARDNAEAASPRRGSPGRAARCEWCGHELDANASRLRARTVCGRCGVATTDPMPTEAELDRAYATWYRPPGGRFIWPGDRVLRQSRGRLAHRLDRIAPPGPVLDVGAGDGALLDALKARGRAAVGLERTADRPDVRAAEIYEIDGDWAGVVFWHTLEHLREAGPALKHAAGLLGPGGTLVIAMPNADSIQARVFGDRWFALDPPLHIVHVRARALITRLRELGLSVERVSHLRGGHCVFGWLYGFLGLLPGHPDLYDAIRRPQARRAEISAGRRAIALGTATALLPVAALCAAGEAAARRGGSVYVEARRV
jgi:hypothetical protein